MLAAQIGFLFSYIVYLKISITQLVNVYTHDPDITTFYGYNKFG